MSRRFRDGDSRKAEKGVSGQPLGKVRFRGVFEAKTEVVILGFILGLAFSVTFGFCNRLVLSDLEKLERVKGIEPSSQAWEAHILPLNHTRLLSASPMTLF